VTRVALLAHGDGAPLADELARALRAAGHDAALVRVRALPEAPLRLRGFTGPLTHLPFALLALRRGGYDVAHAFSAPDAAAALAWRRLGGGAVVFTCAEELRRERLSDARLRLALLQAALEDSDALAVATEAGRAALRRWMALDAPVLEPRDAAGHEALYAAALTRARAAARGRPGATAPAPRAATRPAAPPTRRA